MGPAAESTSETLQFPKLNGTNYHVWADNMKAALQAKSLWGIVSGRERCPVQPPHRFPKLVAAQAAEATEASSAGEKAPEASSSKQTVLTVFEVLQSKEYRNWESSVNNHEKWLNRDDAAMGLMKNAIEYTQHESIIDSNSSQDMWDRLHMSYFQQRSGINVHYLYQQLYSRKWNENSPISDHVSFYLSIRRQFIEAGHRVDDVTVINALLLSLPHTPTWEVVKQNLLYKGPSLTIENVTTELASVYDRLMLEDTADGVNKKTKTLALVSTQSDSSRRPGKGGSKQSGGRKKLSVEERKARAKKYTKPEDICKKCGRKGHWSIVCHGEITKDPETAHLAVDDLAPSNSREARRVYMATTHRYNDHSEILLDSAASCHMFSNRDLFLTYEEVKNDHISTGGSHRIAVEGRGTIRMFTRVHPEFLSTVTLENVLHVPELNANLVSLGTLQRAGAIIQGIGNGISISINNEETLLATLMGTSGTLYRIHHEGIANDEITHLAKQSTMRLWHRRMGHLSPSTIRTMERSNIVRGLKIHAPTDYDYLCAGCAHGKSHRLPLPNASESRYERMELIVMDLTGPMNVPTWDGYTYALVMVEVSCRYPVARLLKSKEDVGPAVRDIIALLERQSGIKARRIRSDNGTEFVNSVMDKFCKTNGIIHETTNPYHPEQNGIAERAIAIFLEMMRSMLHTAEIDLRYWGEAFMYAVHIRSLTPTSGLEGLVPYEAWTGRKPDVSHLRIFGSFGWALVPKEVRHGKLESRAVRVRMLGWWTDETKGWQLEDLENGKLIASRDVNFDENDAPSELASIDLPRATTEEVDEFVDDAIDNGTSSEDEPESAEALEQRLLTPPNIVSPASKPPPAPRKTTKWSDLPKREPSSRTRKPVERYGQKETTHVAFLTIGGEPSNYKEMMDSPNRDGWKAAVDAEYRQLKEKGVFEWVESLPEGKKAVGSRTVYRDKLDGHGNHVKFKSRIVARGFSQIPGEDFNETFSSVAKFTTLRVFLSLAAFLDFDIHQIDIVGAYLQGDLDEEIYMEIPEEIKELDPDAQKGYWRLRKSLYGLKQSGRQWKKRLHDILVGLGFTRAWADDCLYILRQKGKISLLILVYVDDMLVAGPNFCMIISLKNDITKHFDITDIGKLEYILGIQVTRDRNARIIYLDQSAYIQKLVTRFGMENCHPIQTPVAVNHHLSSAQSPSTTYSQNEYNAYANGIHYLSLVGSLLFATQTRPDIQFGVGLVAQFSGNPGIAHLATAKRILRYLKGTANFRLALGRRKEGELDLVGWSDSNWAQDLDTRKSKQSVVATSTVEAEYVASANATREAVWLRTLLKELDFPQTDATIIHADNQGCIALAGNPVSHSRAKHIDIRHHFIRERIENKEIKLEYISTKNMLADIFTKALPRESFIKFRERLGVLPGVSSRGRDLGERADGLFIYATSAIRYIEQNTGGSRLGPEERLQVLLRPDEEGQHAKLSKLDRLYLLIMDQIPKETLPSTLVILYAYDYLSVVRSGSSRKIWLTIPVISSVLGLSQPAFYDAISPLCSVLQEYTQQGMSHPSLQFFHSSFTEFLANPARSQANYHIQTNEICTLFYSACVDVLCQPPPAVSKRHSRYKDYESQEQKEIVVRQAAFTILFSIPSWVEYFRLSEHPDILAKMTQIDWNLHARAYEASALLQIYTYSTISKQIPWNWRPQIIRPKKGFHQLIYKVLGPFIGDKLVLKRTDKFVLGRGDKKALIDGSDLKPYHRKFE
ncbi:hypothetical protein NP233_g11654 [Leucocoprinus birnbaumii]|uniref:Integrase catalytic domain-containing protein n=1 Tax=Leucocoprinus birnbaumii TaxID=56174 RepID=A0AAD5VH26_9AGAR|nr:hypothetical protein NP233_g11654 [Leucocoprinus birnbaumii]